MHALPGGPGFVRYRRHSTRRRGELGTRPGGNAAVRGRADHSNALEASCGRPGAVREREGRGERPTGRESDETAPKRDSQNRPDRRGRRMPRGGVFSVGCETSFDGDRAGNGMQPGGGALASAMKSHSRAICQPARIGGNCRRFAAKRSAVGVAICSRVIGPEVDGLRSWA